jgi:hypothetical protein
VPHRPLIFGATLAVSTGAVAVLAAIALGIPLHDPDSVVGPGYIRLPAFLIVVFTGDVVVRAVRRAGPEPLLRSLGMVARERWTVSRVAYALAGLVSFYVCYVANRSLKGYAPFLRDGLWDEPLARADAVLFRGADIASAMHTALGTGVAAHVLSTVYLLYLFFIPVTLALALVWNTHPSRGMAYVNALCINWALGAACYLLLPSLGPIYTDPASYADLPATGVSVLQDVLWEQREAVLADPTGSGTVYGIGAFASLHVSILFTAALFSHRAGLRRRVRVAAWVYFALTTVATLYFGWHYVLDDVAGVAIGWIAVEVATRVGAGTKPALTQPGQLSLERPISSAQR